MDFNKLRYSHLVLRQLVLREPKDISITFKRKDIKRLASIVEELSRLDQLIEKSVLTYLDDAVILRVIPRPFGLTSEFVEKYKQHLYATDFFYEYQHFRDKSVGRSWVQSFFSLLQKEGFPEEVLFNVNNNWPNNHLPRFIDYLESYTEYRHVETIKTSRTNYALKITLKRR